MLYDLLFSEQELKKLRVILELAKDLKTISQEEIQHMINYIDDEKEFQDQKLRGRAPLI